MMTSIYLLRFTPESVRDIIESADFYENRQKGLGRKFKAEVKSKLILIKKNPFVYAIRYNSVRLGLTEVFPFSIHFSICEEAKTIQIHAVLSHYRDPDEFWNNKF